MPISVECPGCRKKSEAPDYWAGKIAKCPTCGYRIDIPAQATVVERQAADQRASHSTQPTRVVITGIDLSINDLAKLVARLSVALFGVTLLAAAIAAAAVGLFSAVENYLSGERSGYLFQSAIPARGTIIPHLDHRSSFREYGPSRHLRQTAHVRSSAEIVSSATSNVGTHKSNFSHSYTR